MLDDANETSHTTLLCAIAGSIFAEEVKPVKLSRRFVNTALTLSLTSLLVLVMSCGEEEVIGPELGDTHKVSATISVGKTPFGIAVTPDGKYVYVTNSEDNTVSIISTASHSVVKVVPVDKFPGGIVVSLDGNFVYVGHYDAHTLAVISAKSEQVVEMVDIGDDLEGMMVISPDGKTIYAFYSPGEINIISAASKQFIGSIDVDPSMDIAIAPDGKWLYVVNPGDDELVQISTATRKVMSSIPLGQGAHDFTNLALNPSGDFVYVPVKNLVLVISTASKEVVQSITVGKESLDNFALTGIAVAPDGKFVYAANGEENSVAIISAVTNSVTETLAVGRGPVNIAINPSGKAIYVANFKDSSVSVIARE